MVLRHTPAAPRRATRRASAIATPLAAAQPIASPQPVEGAAGLAGGSLRLTLRHPPVTALAVSLAASSDEPVAATFQPTLLSTYRSVLSPAAVSPLGGKANPAGSVRGMFPGEKDYRAERAALLATMESLTPEEFESGPTLCEGWAPRDVLSHLIGIDDAIPEYVKAAGWINKANARIVERFRAMSRDELLDRARRWAERPATLSLTASYFLLGDLAVHHQDVLRGLGRHRDVPRPVAEAALREGTILGVAKLKDHRVEATDTGRKVGRGRVVRGTAEALGMWLCGRRSVESELVFGAAD